MCQLTQTLADLWLKNLFLGGTNMTDLRSFGKEVTLNGVDLDNGTGNGTHYDTFMSTLTLYFKTDSSRTYYVSADPEASQVSGGNKTSIPKSVMPYINFLNVQSYNDQVNELGGPGFKKNIQAWDKLLSSVSPNPKLIVAIPRWPRCCRHSHRSYPD